MDRKSFKFNSTSFTKYKIIVCEFNMWQRNVIHLNHYKLYTHIEQSDCIVCDREVSEWSCII